jgi:expansin (peptidoglycan-binding protein)
VFVAACGSDAADASSSSSKDLTSSDGTGGVSSFPTDGHATFYDATGGGACSFDKTPNDLNVTAMDLPEFDGSNACGTCLQVKGPNGTVTVRVVDSCPGCADKSVNLDLSASAFAKIADPKTGKIDMTYAQVPCVVSGNIQYHFKDGSSKYWTAIQIRNHRMPISKLEYQNSGAYVDIPRLDYNYFVVDKGVGDQPNGLTVRVTSTDGQTIEDTLPGTITANATVSGKAQFH